MHTLVDALFVGFRFRLMLVDDPLVIVVAVLLVSLGHASSPSPLSDPSARGGPMGSNHLRTLGRSHTLRGQTEQPAVPSARTQVADVVSGLELGQHGDRD